MSTGQAKLVWVTGATGFLGRHAVRRFAAAGWRVVALCRREPDPTFPASGGIERYVTANWTGAGFGEAVSHFGSPDAVFHAVGSGSVGVAERDPVADVAATIRSLETLLDALRRHAPLARLVYPSSAAVYGHVPRRPIVEDASVNPISHYGRHKLRAEELCREANRTDGLPIALIRFFSVYGAEQRKLLFWEVGRRMLNEDGPLELAGTGDEVRDFLAVEDAVDLVVLLTEAELHQPILVNGGTGRGTTIRDAVVALAKATRTTLPVRFTGATRDGDPPSLIADMRTAATLGFRARIDLEAGFVRFATWLRTARPSDPPLRVSA
jgi:UDP-glucose 4-epimerase